MSSPSLFTGCATALVTPFTPDGDIDTNALKNLIRFQIHSNADAIVILGTTGEPSTLTMDERESIIQTSLREINGRIPLIVGTGANNTKKAVEYAFQAKRLGAQGQLCVTPYYNKTTQPGLIQHFETILDQSALPMIIYNVPSRTGMSITVDTACRLSEHHLIFGIKEASGDISFTGKLISATQGALHIYCGNDDMIVPMMSMGAAGVISVCSNIVPAQIHRIVHACMDNNTHEARKEQIHLLPLIHALFSQINPIPAKAALAMMGLIHNELRMPLVPLEAPYNQKLHDLLIDLKIID